MRCPLCHPLPHLNDSPQSLQEVHRLERSQPVLVQQLQNVVNDLGLGLGLGLGEEIRLREDSLKNAGTRILAAKLGDA